MRLLRAVVVDFIFTAGVWRSFRITIFGTYQGASTVRRKALDWKHSMISVFEAIVRMTVNVSWDMQADFILLLFTFGGLQ
jgi:hypothetical protein